MRLQNIKSWDLKFYLGLEAVVKENFRIPRRKIIKTEKKKAKRENGK